MHDGKLAFLMVGLPARGKSYIARKVAGYTSWLGVPTRTFNVGSYRRSKLGGKQTQEFFDPTNSLAVAARREIAFEALTDMIAWLKTEGDIAIYDATNSTRERRALAREACEREGIRVVFLESICDDPAIIAANIRETKLRSPDYADVDPERAVSDFQARIHHYERAYEPVEDSEGSYVKLIDAGRKITLHRIHGFMQSRVVSFLMNLHTGRRTIWLTRHGESEFNVEGRIGGDAPLTARGEVFARSLADHLHAPLASADNVTVWTSTLRRSIDTAALLPWSQTRWRSLDEIDAGVCDGMTYTQIADRWPDEYRARQSDKLRYRYPRGESYQDVIARLEPLILELERQRSPIVIVGHLAIARALYAYLMAIPQDRCPHIALPLHTVLELTPNAYGVEERRHALEPGG